MANKLVVAIGMPAINGGFIKPICLENVYRDMKAANMKVWFNEDRTELWMEEQEGYEEEGASCR